LWDEFTAERLPLNRATGLRLGIMAASCSGLWGIRAVQIVGAAPFLAIIGPNRKLNAREVIDSSRAFYTKILAGATGDAAMEAMNEAAPPLKPGDLPTFGSLAISTRAFGSFAAISL
jgi:hypothetical protein